MIDSFTNEYRFLSNFWPCIITFEGIQFPSVEHAFQAAKTLKIGERREIASMLTPGQAKREGRKVTLRDDWNDVKLFVMRELLEQKFQDKVLSQKLADTSPQKLVEGNSWHDSFWGICYCGNCMSQGLNHLGKLLMEIRDEQHTE
jgi:ribA/ribD-fused uncharacterized protein